MLSVSCEACLYVTSSLLMKGSQALGTSVDRKVNDIGVVFHHETYFYLVSLFLRNVNVCCVTCSCKLCKHRFCHEAQLFSCKRKCFWCWRMADPIFFAGNRFRVVVFFRCADLATRLVSWLGLWGDRSHRPEQAPWLIAGRLNCGDLASINRHEGNSPASNINTKTGRDVTEAWPALVRALQALWGASAVYLTPKFY